MKINKTPILISILLVALALFYFAGLRNALLFVNGIGLGFLFVYGSIGFTGAWRSLIVQRSPYAFYAQLFLLALGILLIMPIYSAFSTLNKISAPMPYSSFFGAFLFGLGMQLGDGCGSGTIAKFSISHYSRYAFVAFLAGSFFGIQHLPYLISLGGLPKINLIEKFNISFAIVLQLGIVLVVFLLATLWCIARSRHTLDSTRTITSDENLENRSPRPSKIFDKKNILVYLSSIKDYKRLFLCILGVAVLAIVFLLLAGHGWGITFGFTLWVSKIAGWLGYDVYSMPYWQDEARSIALYRSVIFDTTSVSNFGMIIGAWYTSLAMRTSHKVCKEKKQILAAILGGGLMGYGAQLAFGCNIGPFFSGISSGSMHGWSWFIFAFIGTCIGVKIRPLMGVGKK